MDPLYLRKRLINQNFNNRALDIHKTEKTESVNLSQDAKTNIKNQAENLAQDIRSEVLNPKQLKMNFLAGMERAGYVKKVMNLPKTLPELLMQLQNEDSIVEEEYAPKYNQEGEGEKNSKEQPKSDIREGVIRNAKETFEEVKDGVKGQIGVKGRGENQQPTKPINQPTVEQPRPNVPQQPKPTMPDVPNVEQPNKPVEQPQVKLNLPNMPDVEPQPINKPSVPNKTPQNTEVKPDSPQQTTPATPQNPSQPVPNKPVEQPQVRPNLPNVPQEQPQINKPIVNQPTNEEPKPNIPQEQPTQNIPPRHSEAFAEESLISNAHEKSPNIEQPQIRPNLPNMPDVEPQPINKPIVNQPTNEEPKPNIPQEPKPAMPELPNFEQPNKPVVNQPNEEPRPNIPQEQQPTQNIPQQPKPTMPELPNIEQPNKPVEQPQVRPDLPNMPDVEPQPINKPIVNQPTNEQPTKPVVNMPDVEPQPINKPIANQPNEQPKPNIPQEQQPTQNIPQQPKPTMPELPHVEQPNKPVEQPQVRPNLPNVPHEEPQPPQQPINQPSVPNTNIKPQPNAPQEPNQPVRPNIPQPHINRPEPRPELPNYRPFEPIHHPEINNLRPNTIMDNRAAIIQNQINQNMPFIKPENPNRHHHHLENRPHLMDETPKPENIQPQIIQNTQTEPTVTEMKQKLSGDAAELFFTGLINLNDLSSSLKDGSKTARSKLIMAMANASRQGIDNSQINDTMKLLNAGMIAEGNSTPSKILKNIIELYLPWYPLQQGVGFDLSIETTPGGSESFLSTLKVWIQTRNYGNVNAILALMAGNSVDMSIKCAKLFPKDDLLKRLKEETSTHSMQSNINVEEISRVESYINSSQQAKVNLSSTYELNPYLLLMAHSFIKNTIIIDSSAIIG